jgi:uncharacterized phage protein (TIGR02218 family)
MTLSSHIATGVTTLCYCWVITRQDATVIGFTDHDQDVTVNGTLCHASNSGITTTQYAKVLGLSEDDMEVEGVIDNVYLTEADLKAGLYDEAEARIYLVNWVTPTEFDLLGVGRIGTVFETEGGGFTADFRSDAHLLGQTVGRAFQRTCQTILGSTECGVNLELAANKHTGTVSAVDGATITVNGADGFDDGWFSYGRFIHNDSGAEFGIRAHDGETIYLWQRPRVTIDVSDTVVLYAGCRRDFDTCKSKFSNFARFRGFPFMPGNDHVTNYPIRSSDG